MQTVQVGYQDDLRERQFCAQFGKLFAAELGHGNGANLDGAGQMGRVFRCPHHRNIGYLGSFEGSVEIENRNRDQAKLSVGP